MQRTSQLAIVGPTEAIREILCGPQNHDEHLKSHRWFLYTRDSERRFQNVLDELKRIHAMRREQESYSEAAE